MVKIFESTKKIVFSEIIGQMVKFIGSCSDENLIRFFKLMEKVTMNSHNKAEARKFRWLIETNHPYKQWIRMIAKLNENARRKFVENVLGYSWFLKETKKRETFAKENGFDPPYLVVIDVTMRCNMKCEGCWAGNYNGTESDMPLETLYRVIEEMRDKMGIHYFVLAGGEPFIRKDLLEHVYAKYPDCQFLVYTNAVLIKDKVADRLAELGNVMPMMSIEGNLEKTDRRRGDGTFNKLKKVADRLRERKILFGYSITATRNNWEEVSSDEFAKTLVDWGGLYGWYFQYIPIGRKPDTSIMLLPEQRNALRKRVYHLRNTYPILLADFWNDGPEVNGCLAGGKQYVHINANGDVEPCVFCHFATHNVNNSTVTEALAAPFMKDIRDNIPYDGNTLRACMLIDRPEVFRKHYEKHQPYSTHPGSETLVTTLSSDLDKNAEDIKRIFDKAWETGDWIGLYPDPPADFR